MPRSSRLLAVAMLILAFAHNSKAGFVLVTSRSALNPSGTFTFSDLGATGTILANPFNLVATSGQTASYTQSSASGLRADQSNGWNGNFSPGEALVLTQFGGPVTVDFGSTKIKSFGLQIQADVAARFSAYISVLDSSGAELAKFTRTGNSTALANGSALFIGIASDSPTTDFSRVQIGISTGGNVRNVAYNAPSFQAVPEPSTNALATLAMACVAAIHRRKQQVKPAKPKA